MALSLDLSGRIALHEQWLEDRNKGMRLDLSNETASRINIEHSNLRLSGLHSSRSTAGRVAYCNMEEVSCSYADFSGTDFTGSSFLNSVLRGVNLSDTTLTGVNFNGADLNGVNLQRDKGVRYAECGWSCLSGSDGRLLAVFFEHDERTVYYKTGWRGSYVEFMVHTNKYSSGIATDLQAAASFLKSRIDRLAKKDSGG